MARATPTDPTGQARNRRAAARALRVRLGRAQRKVLAAFREIPRKRRRVADIAVNLEVYDYEVEGVALAALLAFILDSELETLTTAAPPGWYWAADVELAYRQGTLSAANTLNHDLAAAAIVGLLVGGLPPGQINIEQLLLSQPHRDAVAAAIEDGYRSVKGLSERTSQQLFQTINQGIRAGSTPTEISQLIRERFGVSGSAADRIANTEINKAFNDAKMRTGQEAAKQLGVRVGVLHISALIPTTRANHAARHGHTYTREAQLAWWDTGANRINCHCTVENVLVDRKGQPLKPA